MALRWPFWAPPSINGTSACSRIRKQQKASPLIFSSPSFPVLSHCVPTQRLSTTVSALLDLRVVNTSLSASSNLIALCGFIILMQKCGHLTSETAPVLSQVSFKLVIPCFLMSKVSSTVSTHQDWRFLAFPLMALIQITLGSILGKLAGFLLYQNSTLNTEVKNDDLTKKALLTAASAFGNTITLPLVFLSGMLSQSDYSTAAGYLALYTVGWSPCLWTLGYLILSSTSGPSEPVGSDQCLSLHNLIVWGKRFMNPPLYGVLIGLLIGATPLSYLCIPAKHKLLLLNASQSSNPLVSFYSMIATILQPILEGARLLGSATVPLQTIVLASTLASTIGSDHDRTERLVPTESETTAAMLERSTTKRTMLDEKAFWALSIIRLLIMPCISLTLLKAIQHHRWLPTDALSSLVLLVLSAMPTAQNLVVMAQLRSTTRPFAGVLANILARQYLLAVVSLTIWIPVFFAFMGMH
ncbi:hypothetical protein GOP47_0018918 [Adiantum capillus-veneris]|uniref:Auxin efflux carrier n=1 Tax=Adiantum capillus-veneris TaxID=13818 RepID=A0A9D4Z980_ADICA|nr:hypothetical protein GOP47_0018918 [Adiantum capillus-veneris]